MELAAAEQIVATQADIERFDPKFHQNSARLARSRNVANLALTFFALSAAGVAAWLAEREIRCFGPRRRPW